MPESIQHKLSRVRPPRVQITYDVETLGAIQKKELPLVVGVIADLAGTEDPENPPAPMRDREFVEIDRDNFNKRMGKIEPKLSFSVPNKLVAEKDKMLKVELRFNELDDFGPVEVLKQVPELNELFELRRSLSDLLIKLDGNDEFGDELLKIAGDTKLLEEVRDEVQKLLPAPREETAEAPETEGE